MIVCGNCDGASPEGSATCAHCGRPLAVDPTPTQEMPLRGQPKRAARLRAAGATGDGSAVGDPHRVAPALARLDRKSQEAARVPLLIAVPFLEEEELVDCVVQGRLEGGDGIAVLTTRRLLLVGAREWDPAMMDFPIDENLTVSGWEGEVAALVLQYHDQHAVIDGIDRTAAHEMADRLRTAGAAQLRP